MEESGYDMALKGELYIAGPFGKEEIDSVAARFRALLGEAVDFEVRRDDRLIGGFFATVNGRVYDASIASRIKDVRHYLTEDGGGDAREIARDPQEASAKQ